MNEFTIALGTVIALVVLTAVYKHQKLGERVPKGNVMTKNMRRVYNMMQEYQNKGRKTVYTINCIHCAIEIPTCTSFNSEKTHIHRQLVKLIEAGYVAKTENPRFEDDFYFLVK